MSDNKKVPLILFSGGLDSSYLLQEKLKEGDVEVLYVTGVLHEDKMEMEQERREKIIRILEESTGNHVLRRRKIDLGPMPFGNMIDHTFSQPPMWMMGALMISDSRIHSELQIGYVSGDQIMPMLCAIKAAWSNLQIISKASGEIPVEFPLLYTTKTEILQKLHPEVVRLIWYCELPVARYTTTIKQAMGLREEDPFPEDYNALTNPFIGNRKRIIRSCDECDACCRMQAAYLTWKKKRGYPYWKYLLRELKSHRRQKAIQEEIKSRQPISDTPPWPSSKSSSLLQTSSLEPCSTELVELGAMPNSETTSG